MLYTYILYYTPDYYMISSFWKIWSSFHWTSGKVVLTFNWYGLWDNFTKIQVEGFWVAMLCSVAVG